MTNIQNIQTTQIKVPQEALISKTLHSTNNKEVKFNYLPEDKVSISIRNEDGTNTDVKKENLPKELEGLTSPEKFTAFLKSAYVKVSKIGDDDKVYVSHSLLGGKGGGKKDGVWKGDKGGQFNVKGDQNEAIQGNNFKNKDLRAGHKGKNAKGHNVVNAGVMKDVRIGDVVINVDKLSSTLLDKLQIKDKTPRMVKVEPNGNHTMDSDGNVYKYGRKLAEYEAAGLRSSISWKKC